MTHNQEDSVRPRRRYRRVALVCAASAVALAACGGAGTPQVASLGSGSGGGSGGSGSGGGSGGSGGRGGSGSGGGSGGGHSTTAPPRGNPTALLDHWATCMHSHGDPSQADPTIDAYGVISINIPAGAANLSNEVHAGADPCNRYVAAAQSALRAAHPVAPPPDQSEGVKYVNCMRANGVSHYPYPTGNTTNFNGTGVDPNSPFVENVNRLCGKKLGLPAWWISGTGPPGDVVVSSGGPPNGGPPPDGGGNNAPRPVVQAGNGGSGGNG